jgi:hypothetical protein
LNSDLLLQVDWFEVFWNKDVKIATTFLCLFLKNFLPFTSGYPESDYLFQSSRKEPTQSCRFWNLDSGESRQQSILTELLI